MIQLLPEKRKALAQANSARFSKTEMWKDVMADLTSVRVVNGKHKVLGNDLCFFPPFFCRFIKHSILKGRVSDSNASYIFCHVSSRFFSFKRRFLVSHSPLRTTIVRTLV